MPSPFTEAIAKEVASDDHLLHEVELLCSAALDRSRLYLSTPTASLTIHLTPASRELLIRTLQHLPPADDQSYIVGGYDAEARAIVDRNGGLLSRLVPPC